MSEKIVYTISKSRDSCGGWIRSVWVKGVGTKDWCSWCGAGKAPKGWRDEFNKLKENPVNKFMESK